MGDEKYMYVYKMWSKLEDERLWVCHPFNGELQVFDSEKELLSFMKLTFNYKEVSLPLINRLANYVDENGTKYIPTLDYMTAKEGEKLVAIWELVLVFLCEKKNKSRKGIGISYGEVLNTNCQVKASRDIDLDIGIFEPYRGKEGLEIITDLIQCRKFFHGSLQTFRDGWRNDFVKLTDAIDRAKIFNDKTIQEYLNRLDKFKKEYAFIATPKVYCGSSKIPDFLIINSPVACFLESLDKAITHWCGERDISHFKIDYYSTTCNSCGEKGQVEIDNFLCSSCGYEEHSALNSAKSLEKIGQAKYIEYLEKEGGRKIATEEGVYSYCY